MLASSYYVKCVICDVNDSLKSWSGKTISESQFKQASKQASKQSINQSTSLLFASGSMSSDSCGE